MIGPQVSAIRLLCPDVARTAAFFRAAFGCAGSDTDLSLGRQRIVLARAARPAPHPARSNSTAFQHFAIVVRDMGRAMARIERVDGWTAISQDGPETLPAHSGGVTAFKFRDPDGHPLEFLRFPDADLPPVWRDGSDLFAGIDHSAITVADPNRAVAFYAKLGFAVANRQVNEGSEQSRLDDVKDARVEVTSLHAPGDGHPNLELLCYRSPATVVENVSDNEARATVLLLTRDGEAFDPADPDAPLLRDPDGHRFAMRDPSTGSRSPG